MARVLITGCSTGFGRAAAIELTQRGHEVIATARRPGTLDDIDVKERVALDVTDDASVAAAVEVAGDVDVLVNNAGVSMRGPVEGVPMEAIRALFETNVFGVIRLLHAVVPGMRERGGGTVVNVSSVAGRIGLPLSGSYSASKFALEALSETLHYEMGRFGIRVVIIEPGYFATNISESAPQYNVEGLYAPLFEQMSKADEQLLGGERPGPEVVAVAIADAIEAEETPLRIPVGADAELATATRAGLGDAEFEAIMRQSLGIDW
ncbi:MAG: SDR family oxidoreductase [Actinobacteria bacterium]|nr:SDR family oxidoreductase [Actinomycetota bacterium]